ncbi:VTT domain-containing protein [Noviherbaspirillum denitrificans]|uniref:Sulfurtransferase n=1 Tax=Noviherbaspirillum denitrificans TaxID=1968433 RepID=A0A254TDT0_9BURK|nr:VTT domain-containing protein [Noviherbaspirillum denitrificans]OWW20806.1 sulfurtransferase [Noviherbaspirillum denitrificans]
MERLIDLLQQYGPLIVFLNVLLEQAGLPLPAYPVLVVAGALAADGQFTWYECLATAVLACLITDSAWYLAGRTHGSRILKTLCRISLSPDYCVSSTEERFRRWGSKSLLVSKFVPGFNTIAPPMSGVLRVPKGRYLVFTVVGTLLWAGSALALGGLFHKSIDRLLDVLAGMGTAAGIALLLLLILFLVAKYAERQRFLKSLRMARISVDELWDAMQRGDRPAVIDARSPASQALEAPIPGAILYGQEGHLEELARLPRDLPVIVYCNCPNEATAAKVARELMGHGFADVRPLVGGLDAWNAWHASSKGQEFSTQG